MEIFWLILIARGSVCICGHQKYWQHHVSHGAVPVPIRGDRDTTV